MKPLSLILCLTLLCLSLIVSGQRAGTTKDREKTRAFAELPATFPAHYNALEKIFTLHTGDRVDIQFHEKFILKGTVIDRVRRNSLLESINIRPDNNPGIMFTFSRLQKNGGQVLFTGRALHRNAGDVLLLNRRAGEYYFDLKQANTVIAE